MAKHTTPDTEGADLLANVQIEKLVGAGQTLFEKVDQILATLFRTWNLYQVAIAVVLFAVAHVLRMIFGPRIREWMASRENWPKWKMRILVVVNQRLRAIFYVILIWAAYLLMFNLTWPSRSYLLGIIATLALSWLLIVFVTRLIKSQFLRKLVRWIAWSYVTLDVFGLVAEATNWLDSAGFNVGEHRLSLLFAVQAFIIIGALIAAARFVTMTTSSSIRSNDDISPSMKVLIIKALQIGFYGAALYLGVNALGIDLTGLAVLSGAIGVGLGFGLQKVVSNLVSGVIILLDKSIKPGDVISLGETFGWINSLGARYVSVK